MDAHVLLTTLAIVLGVAGVTTVVTRQLGLSSVLGYLVAGLVVGPNVAFPVYANRDVVTTLSELGVILLMFSIGLELSIRKVTRLAGTAGPAAFIEMGLMGVLGLVTARLLGLGSLEGAFLGAMIAISSTMVIAKTFADQKVKGHVVEVVFGILVFEDIAAIILLTVLTGLSAGLSPSPVSLAITLAKLAGFLLGAIALGLPLIPRFMRLVVRFESPETTTVAAVGVCFALAAIASWAGFSVALGAIIAGVLCAESGHGEKLEHLVAPLRDLFSAIFFVSVGMLIDPLAIADEWFPVLVITAVVLVGKFVSVTIGAVLSGQSVGTAAKAAACLTQIGEFSFIIAGLGVTSGTTSSALLPIAVVVSAITAFTTPYAIGHADRIATTLEGRLPEPLRTTAALYHAWVARLRGRRLEPTRAAGRRQVRLILLEAAGIVVLAAATGLVADPVASYLRAFTGIPAWVLRAILGLLVMAFSVPFAIGIVRNARALASNFSNALSGRTPSDPTQTIAPEELTPLEKTLRVGLTLAIILVVGAPLLAVVLPLLPFGSTVALASIALLTLLIFASPIRRSVREARSGAQVVLDGFRRQLRTETLPETAAISDATLAAFDGGRSGRDVAVSRAESAVLDSLDPTRVLTVESSWACVGESLMTSGSGEVSEATVLAVLRRDGLTFAPVSDVAFEPGDRIVASGSPEAIDELTRVMTHGPSPNGELRPG